jgi:phosphoribosylaminoimidazolecarboxamide formyltransferase/IMP cyclohydrolase
VSEPRRAILSVSDKTGVVELGRGLRSLGWELISTGGTARALREAGLAVVEVSAFTGAPEILEGRVKTLHPKVHGGILARRGREDDMATLASLGYPPVDLVAVNLYPFEGRPSLEEIDIGGPTLVRAAAKNHEGVIVLVRPEDYGPVLEELRGAGDASAATRRRLAAAAFARIAEYDIAIAAWLGTELRYGENPHQRGALVGEGPGRVSGGKEISYNNLIDVDAALALVSDLPRPGAAVIKHATPCGAAAGADARAAFERAYDGDPLSAYGGIVALNVEVTLEAALAMVEPAKFLECVAAPSFASAAREALTTRPKWGKNVRLIEAGAPPARRLVRTIAGGLLVQEADLHPIAEEAFEVVTKRRPTPELEADLRLAIAVAKHARSNAIAVVKDGALAGCGAGQTSRVDATEIALRKAGERARGAALASDAFFPFPDSLERAAAAGVAAAVAPRGSRRDAEVAAAADALGIALCFTDLRHFRH